MAPQRQKTGKPEAAAATDALFGTNGHHHRHAASDENSSDGEAVDVAKQLEQAGVPVAKKKQRTKEPAAGPPPAPANDPNARRMALMRVVHAKDEAGEAKEIALQVKLSNYAEHVAALEAKLWEARFKQMASNQYVGVDMSTRATAHASRMWAQHAALARRKKLEEDPEEPPNTAFDMAPVNRAPNNNGKRPKFVSRDALYTAEELQPMYEGSDGDDEYDESRMAPPPQQQASQAQHDAAVQRLRTMGAVANAVSTITAATAKANGKAPKGAKTAKTEKAKPEKRKRTKIAYNYFVEEVTPTIKAEGVEPGAPFLRRCGELWTEQKLKPEGIAKWKKMECDAKEAAAAESAPTDPAEASSSDA